jgi:hypothetical protein
MSGYTLVGKWSHSTMAGIKADGRFEPVKVK